MNQVIARSDSSPSSCVSFRIPDRIVDQLRDEARGKQISLNTMINQIIEEHLDWHALAPKAKLYYLPKSFLVRIINQFTEEELRELAKDMAKSDLVDICLFLRGEFTISTVLDITQTWLRISKMPYRYETRQNSSKIIIQHDMGYKYSYLTKEIFRNILEVAFEAKPSYEMTDYTLAIIYRL